MKNDMEFYNRLKYLHEYSGVVFKKQRFLYSIFIFYYYTFYQALMTLARMFFTKSIANLVYEKSNATHDLMEQINNMLIKLRKQSKNLNSALDAKKLSDKKFVNMVEEIKVIELDLKAFVVSNYKTWLYFLFIDLAIINLFFVIISIFYFSFKKYY